MSLEKLLSILADGEFHSGEALSQALSVSRTAVWKQVAKLESFGLQVNAVKGRGYRLLEPLDLLSMPAIYEELNENAYEVFSHLDTFLAVDSTNRVASAAGVAPYACLAEMQTAGRGRRGREWVSPFAKNIYLSVAWQFANQAASLDSLSLCVAVSLAKSLRQLGCDGLMLKWPNDLLFQHRKLAGILLEASGELGGSIRVVVGIGLNVAMTAKQGAGIDQQWVSLSEVLPQSVPRSSVAAALLNALAESLPRFENDGFSAFQQDWKSFDCLADKAIDLHMGGQVIPGIARGVDATGALLIEHDGGVSAYRGGEVSVRARS